MICKTSCAIFFVFLVSSIIMGLMTSKLPSIVAFESTLDEPLNKKYKEIVNERRTISFQGYGLGLLISLSVLLYNYTQSTKTSRYSTNSMVCVAGSITFLTHYFYYILSTKQNWMVLHLKTQEQRERWLTVYKTYQMNYHSSLLLGVISSLMLGRVFKCPI